MENLFYSPSEKILFYVAGYTDNTSNVKGIISMLQNNYLFFFGICGVKTINTCLVEKSPRYKGMRVFYCTTDSPPAEAHVLNVGKEREDELLATGYTKEQIQWTMDKWLTN